MFFYLVIEGWLRESSSGPSFDLFMESENGIALYKQSIADIFSE
jgi:hypothetical protein